IEEQSTKTEYVCLNVTEAPRLGSREAVEKHFREVHLANIVKPVEQHMLSGSAGRQLRSPGLQRLLRHAWEDQKRFPLQIATVLSQQFAAHGLQFFKVNRTVTHVSVARPRYLDMDATPVSEGVKRIVDFINAGSRCTRRKLVAALAPVPAPAASAPAPSPGPPAPDAPAPEPTPEQTAIASDLHWLIHEGHVIEFANGVLETAKKPLPRPPKPEKKTEPSATVAAPSAPPALEVPDLETEEQSNEPVTVADPGPAPPAAEPPATDMATPQPAAPTETVSPSSA
ncbi:MAG: hypothetical protein ACLQUR_12330, partial [Limisphaerales bacterium]